MEESPLKKHVSLVAALHIGYGIMLLILAAASFFALSFALSMVEYDEIAHTVIHFLSRSIPVMFLCLAMLSLIGGIGLLGFKKWARILVLIASALDLLHLPLGTALGIYSFYTLMQDDSIRMLN